MTSAAGAPSLRVRIAPGAETAGVLARSGALPFVILTALAARDGGYWPTSWGWTSLGLLWVVALTLLLARDLRLTRLEAAQVATLLGFFAWVLTSSVWSLSTTRTLLEAQRGLVYPAALAALLVVVRGSSARGVIVAVWSAIALVTAYSVSTRLFPERLGSYVEVAGARLAEPIGYWNGLGLFAAIGIVLAVGIAASRARTAARAVAAASLVPIVLTLYFTFSRGAWIALGLGLAVFLAVEPRRLRAVAIALVLAPWPGLAVWLAASSEALAASRPPLELASREGHRLAYVAALLAFAAAAACAGLARVENRFQPGRRLQRGFAALLVGLALAGAVALVVAYGSPATIARDGYHAFTGPSVPAGDDPNRRLFNLSGNDRDVQWRVAWNQFREHPWAGSGAGTYERFWLRDRPYPAKVRDAHSLYVEVLAEVGPLGLALLAAALVLPLLAAAQARRRPLVSAGLGGYVAFLAHAGIDWDWELPAVTLAGLFCGAGLLVAARPQDARLLGDRVRLAAVAATVLLSAFALVGLIGNSALSNGWDALESGDSAGARADASDAIRWAPWSSEGRHLLASAQAATDEQSAARANLRRAVDKDPTNWSLWFELAQVSEGRAERAALAQALRLNPLSPEVGEYIEANGLDPVSP